MAPQTVPASPSKVNPDRPEPPGFVVCPDADAGPEGLFCQAFDAETRVRCDRSLVPFRDPGGRLWTVGDALAAAYRAGLVPPPAVLCRNHLSILKGWRDRNPGRPLPVADVE